MFGAVSAWGLGAAVAALYGLRQFSVRPSLHGGVTFLRSRLATSSWLAGERAAGWGASQLYLILAGVLLGPATLGGLKAAQALALGPTVVIVNAGGSIGLPEASRRFAEHGWGGMVRVSRMVTGAGVVAAAAWGLVILVGGDTLLSRLYGPTFVAYAMSARIFAISYVIGAFGVGPTLTLMTTVRTRPLFIMQLGRLAFSVAAVSLLSAAYGVNGAALSFLLAQCFTNFALFLLQWSARRTDEKSERVLPVLESTDG